MTGLVSVDRNSLMGGVVVGIPVASLGVAIGHTALTRPRTGTSEPLGRGPVSGGLGRIAGRVPMSWLARTRL